MRGRAVRTLLGPCLLALLALEQAGATAPPRELRVCADPNNLPFSNERGEGFENRIAEVLARELDAEVRYTWRAQRRGFIRETLNAGACDVIIGIPADVDMVRTTRPYYRSTYVFVTRRGSGPEVRSLDDPVLRKVRVGIHLIGDDFANAPPSHSLARRGIVRNVVGYTVYGNYAEPNPPARLIEAVAAGEVHVALAWGPLAGYFARRQPVALQVTPVTPALDLGFLPMTYDIALGVRRKDAPLAAELERALARVQPQLDAILDAYAVPRLPLSPARTKETDDDRD